MGERRGRKRHNHRELLLCCYEISGIKGGCRAIASQGRGKQCGFSKLSECNEAAEPCYSMIQRSHTQVAVVNMYINNYMNRMSELPAGLVKTFYQYSIWGNNVT